MAEYPDNDGNGIPDAFENRLPISEVLQQQDKRKPAKEHSVESVPRSKRAPVKTDTPQAIDSDNTLILELDLRQRPPKRGEMYLFINHVKVASYDEGSPQLIVKRIIAAPSWWKPSR